MHSGFFSLGRNRFKKMIRGYLPNRYSSLWDSTGHCTSDYESVVYSKELDEASLPIKRRRLLRLTFEKMSSHFCWIWWTSDRLRLPRKWSRFDQEVSWTWMILNALWIWLWGSGFRTVKDLFSANYEFSDDVYNMPKADQDAIRLPGSRVQGRFDAAVNQVAKDVHRWKTHSPSFHYYRP